LQISPALHSVCTQSHFSPASAYVIATQLPAPVVGSVMHVMSGPHTVPCAPFGQDVSNGAQTGHA
jgi:hypothetical protein